MLCPNPQCGLEKPPGAERCPRCGTRFGPRSATPGTPARSIDQSPPVPQAYLEIDTGRWRRWIGWVAYVLAFFAVALVFTLIFVRVSGSWRIAIGVVSFMILYMVVMGYVTSRGLRGDRDGPGLRR